jgi:hypothetical protein
MPIRDMSAGHLVSQGGSFEPQRQNNALLRIQGLMTGNSGEDIVTLSLESFPIPKTAIEAMELDFLNEKRKFAGKVNVEDLSVVVKDFVDISTMQVLYDWFLQTYDPFTGQIGLAKYYKKRGTVTMYGPNGAFDREFNCVGLWINNFDPGDIDMTSGDKKVINLTLSIDKVLPGKGVYGNSGQNGDSYIGAGYASAVGAESGGTAGLV